MNYTIMEKESFKVLGIRRITPYGGGTWAIVKSDGSNERIKEISGKFFDLGLCFGFREDFEAKGAISDNVLGNVWKRINNDFLPNSKYKKCMATIERYVSWNDAEDFCNVEIWIPVAKK